MMSESVKGQILSWSIVVVWALILVLRGVLLE